MAASGRWTENRPLSLSFRLNPWPFSRALTHLQVWNGQHGSEEVASGLSASPSMDGTLTSISPLSPLPFHFIILSGSGILEGIQLSLLINQFCLHCFKCLWQAAKYAYTDILIKLVLDATSFYWSSCGTLAHSCGDLPPHPVMFKQKCPSSVLQP